MYQAHHRRPARCARFLDQPMDSIHGSTCIVLYWFEHVLAFILKNGACYGHILVMFFWPQFLAHIRSEGNQPKGHIYIYIYTYRIHVCIRIYVHHVRTYVYITRIYIYIIDYLKIFSILYTIIKYFYVFFSGGPCRALRTRGRGGLTVICIYIYDYFIHILYMIFRVRYLFTCYCFIRILCFIRRCDVFTTHIFFV